MKTKHHLDRFDLKILKELQRNGSLSNQELAERVGLTAAPCSRRVKALEDSGVIAERVVRLDHRAVNLNLIALLHISMDKHIPDRFDSFEKAIGTFPEVLECYLITGHDADYLLKIAVPDMDAYHDFLLGRITRLRGVTGVKSSFMMRKIVDTTALPLDYVSS
ncbi:Lrp/AsnC family transcriptional regulator [Spongorhabdus nitratireducens]